MTSKAFTCLTALVFSLAAANAQNETPVAKPPVSSVSVQLLPGALSTAKPAGILLKKDGSAVMVVERGKQKGTFRATGLTDDFDKAAKGLYDCNFWQLMDRFGPHGMRVPMIVVTVKSEGSLKSVTDAGLPRRNEFGRKAPAAFKQVEETLVNLMGTAKWQKVSDKLDLSATRA